MDEKESETSEAVAMETEEAEKADDDVNIKELMQLDEILGSSATGKIKMLDFERQMFLDCVYNDGLVICGK